MLTRLSQWLYPPRCVLCQRPGLPQLDLCANCHQALPFIARACQQCALPLAAASHDSTRCGRCLKKPPMFDASLSALRYQGAVVGLVTGYKFHDRLLYSRLLAELLLPKILRGPLPDCIIAVPLHQRRLRARGFNQSHELGKIIAARLQLPLLSHAVVRTRDTPQQTGLDARQRRKNIRGAFEVVQPLDYQHVALVDDVVTTGSTVNELARVLKKAGAQTVTVWSIARAV